MYVYAHFKLIFYIDLYFQNNRMNKEMIQLTKTIQYINTNKMFHKVANTSCRLNTITEEKLNKISSNLSRIGMKDIPKWQIVLAGLMSLENDNISEASKLKTENDKLKKENFQLVSDMNKLKLELFELRRRNGDRTGK